MENKKITLKLGDLEYWLISGAQSARDESIFWKNKADQAEDLTGQVRYLKKAARELRRAEQMTTTLKDITKAADASGWSNFDVTVTTK